MAVGPASAESGRRPCSRLLLNPREMRRHGQHCDADPRQSGAQKVGPGTHRRIADLGGRNRASLRADDRYAVADLVARRRGQILRRLRGFHDRRGASADSSASSTSPPIEHGVIGAASLFGILVGALALGGLSDRFGRKPMFIVEMIIFVAFLVALCFCVQLRPGGDLPVRAGACARLRLPDRAHDHLRKHPELSAGQAGARRVRVSGGRRARRHRCRVSRPIGLARARRLAMDVRERNHSGGPGHDWPLLHRRERQLAIEPGRDRKGRARGASDSWCASRNIRAKSSSPRPRPRLAPRRDRELWRALQQRKPARDNPGVGPVVPAGSWNLRNRHLHADHPCRRARRHFRPCPQHRRRDLAGHHRGQGRGADHVPAARRHRLRHRARGHGGQDFAAGVRLHRLCGRSVPGVAFGEFL